MPNSFECRLCGGHGSDELLDLGPLPLSNNFRTSLEDAVGEAAEPVTAAMCGSCNLIQLRDRIDRDRMFRDYPWTSSSSRSAVSYAQEFARGLRRVVNGGFVVEVGSNDGLMLRALSEAGYRTLGVEPSAVAQEANAAGLTTIEAYFDDVVASKISDEHGRADVVVARNVLGHTDDLVGMLAGIAHLLHDDGFAVIEVPYMGTIRENLSYDYFFHEHTSYFTAETLATALRRFGLGVAKLELSPMNGGSLVCYARKGDGGACAEHVTVGALEALTDLNSPSGWIRFSADAATQRRLLREEVERAADRGVIAAYGAAAKTVTMLNFCGIDHTMLPVIADGSSRKQGLYTPGGGSRVISPAELRDLDARLVIIGPVNMAPEITAGLRGSGYHGQIMLPLPYPAIVGPAVSPDEV